MIIILRHQVNKCLTHFRNIYKDIHKIISTNNTKGLALKDNSQVWLSIITIIVVHGHHLGKVIEFNSNAYLEGVLRGNQSVCPW